MTQRVECLGKGFVELVDSMPQRLGPWPGETAPGDQRIVDAARVSIAGEDVRPSRDDRKLIRYLVRNEHLTPLEQVRFTFRVKLPIFVARQWMRHRACSYNEMSARYSKLPADFYIPSLERMMEGGQAKKNKQASGEPLDEKTAKMTQEWIEDTSHNAYKDYEALLHYGVARELARMVLPTNIYTTFYWTVDLRNLFHFLRLRLDNHAQYEIRVYAEALEQLARPLCPFAFEAFVRV